VRKINPAAGANRSEVGVTSEGRTHLDLRPLRTDLKKGTRYLLHVFLCEEYEAPKTETWSKRTVTVEVIATGRGWIDERTWTFDWVHYNDQLEPIFEPSRPPGLGWNFERRVKPRSSSWVRRREVA